MFSMYNIQLEGKKRKIFLTVALLFFKSEIEQQSALRLREYTVLKHAVYKFHFYYCTED